MKMGIKFMSAEALSVPNCIAYRLLAQSKFVLVFSLIIIIQSLVAEEQVSVVY